jgi:hypothetical protein
MQGDTGQLFKAMQRIDRPNPEALEFFSPTSECDGN